MLYKFHIKPPLTVVKTSIKNIVTKYIMSEGVWGGDVNLGEVAVQLMHFCIIHGNNYIKLSTNRRIQSTLPPIHPNPYFNSLKRPPGVLFQVLLITDKQYQLTYFLHVLNARKILETELTEYRVARRVSWDYQADMFGNHHPETRTHVPKTENTYLI